MSSIPGQGTRISHATGHGQQILNIIIIFKGIFLKGIKKLNTVFAYQDQQFTK